LKFIAKKDVQFAKAQVQLDKKGYTDGLRRTHPWTSCRAVRYAKYVNVIGIAGGKPSCSRVYGYYLGMSHSMLK